MNREIAISVRDIKKSFKVYYDRNKTLKDILAMPGRGRQERREVLKGISFQVKKGEAVALIGKNGCGKSTMLKLLTKIIYPDSGKIEVHGKISSLIELGAGFHPDMSGRENIYLNASIFGLNKKEIDEKLDEIIQFSELEKFIDNPVRTYSSGMYMRLAFSVAINVKADILLIDEILGVGDVSFQKKCFERLKDIKDEGTTIVIVSHSMSQIEQICDRSIWIYDGMIREEGKAQIVDQHYYKYMETERLNRIENEYFQDRADKTNLNQKEEVRASENDIKDKKMYAGQEDIDQTKSRLPSFAHKNAIHEGGGNVKFTDIKLCNEEKEAIIFKTNDKIYIDMKIHSDLPECIANIYISVYNWDHLRCYGTNFYSEENKMFVLQKENEIIFCLDKLHLLSGKYYLSVGVYTKQLDILDEFKFVKEFFVHSEYDMKETGMFHMEHFWKIDSIRLVDDENK